MKRPSRDAQLTIAVFAVLVVLWGVAAVREARRAAQPALSTLSSEPEGARALYLWLEALGYRVDNGPQALFAVPANTDVVFVLEPAQGIGESEARQLAAWVDEGGTLIVAGESFALLRYLADLDLALRYVGGETLPARALTPLTAGASAAAPLTIATDAILEPARDDVATLLAAADRPVVVTYPAGQGRVVVSAGARPFTNAALGEGDSGALVLGLLRALAPDARRIWFDEWHHGLRRVSETGGPQNWLRYTPAGRSILFLAVLAFVVLLVNGRRLGRPLRTAAERRRRSPLEFVDAMANLSRRAGHRRAVQDQIHGRLKRELGAPYRIDPTVPDAAFVAELARVDPDLDSHRLAQLLTTLQRPDLSEADLVKAANEAGDMLER